MDGSKLLRLRKWLPREFRPERRLFVGLACLLCWASLGCGGGSSEKPVAQPPPNQPLKSESFTGTAPRDQESGEPSAFDPPATDVAGTRSGEPKEETPKGETEPGDLAQDPTAAAGQPSDEDAKIGDWLKDLVSDDPSERDAALSNLAVASTNAKHAAARLLAADESITVRRGAAFYLLERFEPDDEVQAAGVVRALRDSDAVVRRMALQLVLRSKSLTVQQLPAVAKLMLDPQADAASRVKAVRGLATMPQEASNVIDILRQVASQAAEPEVRSAAVYTLSRVDQTDEGVAAIVTRLSTDQVSSVRKLAAARLGRIKAPQAVDPLCAALKDGDADVRQSAADALGRMGSPAVEPLTKQLSDSNAAVRKLAVYALGKNGAAALPAVPQLEALADKDADQGVRKLAELTVRIIKTER